MTLVKKQASFPVLSSRNPKTPTCNGKRFSSQSATYEMIFNHDELKIEVKFINWILNEELKPDELRSQVLFLIGISAPPTNKKSTNFFGEKCMLKGQKVNSIDTLCNLSQFVTAVIVIRILSFAPTKSTVNAVCGKFNITFMHRIFASWHILLLIDFLTTTYIRRLVSFRGLQIL